MMKKIAKSLLMGFLVFLAGLMIFYIAFQITYKKSIKAASSILSASQTTSAAESKTEASGITASTPDCFIARYDGKSIVIYRVTDGKEEFLYTLKLRIEDIPKDELSKLKTGVVLEDKKALASFEEDFTS